MKIVIDTQDYEARGDRWKPSGGETFYCSIPLEMACSGYLALEQFIYHVLVQAIDTDNEFYRCHVTGWTLEEDTYKDSLWLSYEEDGDSYPLREMDLLGQRYYNGKLVTYRYGEVIKE